MMLGLKGHVLKCIFSQHGNYVIQKIITKFHLGSLDWLLNEISTEKDIIIALVKHQYGCRIFCRLFEKFHQDDLALIWDIILENIDGLIAHDFGCYPLTTYVQAYNSHKYPHAKDKINIILAHLLGLRSSFIGKRPTISCLAQALLQNDGELEEKLALALNTCILLEESNHLTKRREKLVAAVDERLLQKTSVQPVHDAQQPKVLENINMEVHAQPDSLQNIHTQESGQSEGAQLMQPDDMQTDKIPKIWTCEQVEKSFGMDGSNSSSSASSVQLVDPSMNMMAMMPTLQSDGAAPMTAVYWVACPWGTHMNDLSQQVCWGWIVNNGQDMGFGVPIPGCP